MWTNEWIEISRPKVSVFSFKLLIKMSMKFRCGNIIRLTLNLSWQFLFSGFQLYLWYFVIILFQDFSNPQSIFDPEEISDIKDTLRSIDRRLLSGLKLCEDNLNNIFQKAALTTGDIKQRFSNVETRNNWQFQINVCLFVCLCVTFGYNKKLPDRYFILPWPLCLYY